MVKKTTTALFGLTLFACASPESEGAKAILEVDRVPPGASISLRAGAFDGKKLTFDLVTRGVDEVYGAAFRLSYDPACLRFVELDRGNAVTDREDALVLGREARPGLLLGVATRVGPSGGVASAGDETAIVRVTLAIESRSDTRLELVPGRSVALDATGHEVVLATSGARLSF